MYADFTTLGAILIKTIFGTVSATSENFTVPPEAMAENEEFLKWVGAEGGVFCLTPWEIDTAF